MAPTTRKQAVLDPKTGEVITFNVTNIKDITVRGLSAEERKALKEKIYGTSKAEPTKPTPPEPPKK